MVLNIKSFNRLARANTLRQLLRSSEFSEFLKKSLPGCEESIRKYTHPLDNPLFSIPFVKIPKNGKFNFMLLFAYNHGESGLGRLIVRGLKAKHSVIVKEAKEEVHEKQLCVKPKGGGKMCHDPDRKVIRVHGKSREFGKANRDDVKEVLLKMYRDYTINRG